MQSPSQRGNVAANSFQAKRGVGRDRGMSATPVGDKENRRDSWQSIDDKDGRSLRHSISVLEQDNSKKRDALHQKDQRLNAMQDELNALKQRLREKEVRERDSLFHCQEQDQQIRQLTDELNESRKQEAIYQAQAQALQNDLSQAERRAEKMANARPPEEKELRSLRQTVSEQMDQLQKQERELRRFSGSASLVSPGEFARMAKDVEAKNVFSVQNASLASRNNELETQASLIKKEIALLRRRLPADVCNEISHEVIACVAAEDVAS